MRSLCLQLFMLRPISELPLPIFTTYFISRLVFHRQLSLLLQCPFLLIFPYVVHLFPFPQARLPQSIVLAIALALHPAPHSQSSFFPYAVYLLSLSLFAVLLVPKEVYSPSILLFTHSLPCPSSPELLACYRTHSLARAPHPQSSYIL